MKIRRERFWALVIGIGAILAFFAFLALVVYHTDNQTTERREMTECREKYTELQIAEVLPYASSSDTKNLKDVDAIGFKIKFTQPITCNGKQVENVFMDQMGESILRTSVKLMIPVYYKDHKYKLEEPLHREISFFTPSDGRDVYIKGQIKVVKVN